MRFGRPIHQLKNRFTKVRDKLISRFGMKGAPPPPPPTEVQPDESELADQLMRKAAGHDREFVPRRFRRRVRATHPRQAFKGHRSQAKMVAEYVAGSRDRLPKGFRQRPKPWMHAGATNQKREVPRDRHKNRLWHHERIVDEEGNPAGKIMVPANEHTWDELLDWLNAAVPSPRFADDDDEIAF